MKTPRSISLLFAPADVEVAAQIVALSARRIDGAMGAAWWDEPAIVPQLAEQEVDRHWDWTEMEIEYHGRILASRMLAAVTGDDQVQGAMLVSTEAIPSEAEPGRPALLVELLFTAPRNRHWLRADHSEQFRGVGLVLLRFACEMSLELGFQGRLRLDASPDFVNWYKKRGLRQLKIDPIVYEDVAYTPMELTADAVPLLLPARAGRKKGTRRAPKND